MNLLVSQCQSLETSLKASFLVATECANIFLAHLGIEKRILSAEKIKSQIFILTALLLLFMKLTTNLFDNLVIKQFSTFLEFTTVFCLYSFPTTKILFWEWKGRTNYDCLTSRIVYFPPDFKVKYELLGYLTQAKP